MAAFLKPAVLAAGLVGLAGAAQAAPDFYVEDPANVPVPAAVSAAIQSASASPVEDIRGKPCTFSGKEVILRSAREPKSWMVTTNHGCGWAASAAPVWIVDGAGGALQVIFSDATYSVRVGRAKHQGLSDIVTERATAALRERRSWRFDGSSYKVVGSRGSGVARGTIPAGDHS